MPHRVVSTPPGDLYHTIVHRLANGAYAQLPPYTVIRLMVTELHPMAASSQLKLVGEAGVSVETEKCNDQCAWRQPTREVSSTPTRDAQKVANFESGGCWQPKEVSYHVLDDSALERKERGQI